MDDHLRAEAFEQRQQAFMVFQRRPRFRETRLPGQLREAAMLEVHVVVIVDAIKAMHGVALAEQRACRMVADETGMACHQNAQRSVSCSEFKRGPCASRAKRTVRAWQEALAFSWLNLYRTAS